MIAIDYFLYDNLTTSARGTRDWGIKAATGTLANAGDLRAAFERYCGAVRGENGLDGFGHAIGGIRPPMRRGYLLCITLKCSDWFGRPSWAIFGLWCPDGATLQEVLTGDPAAAVQSVLGADPPPNAIAIQPGTADIQPQVLARSSETAYQRFDSGTTPREVLSLLLGASITGSVLPNVLGITATSRLEGLQEKGFDLVYSHPRDPAAERALTPLLRPLQWRQETPAPAPPKSARFRIGRSHARVPRTAAQSLERALWAFLAVTILAVLLLSNDRILQMVMMRRQKPAAIPAAQVPKLDQPGRRSPQLQLLEDLQQRVAEFRSLDPEELRCSDSFTAIQTLKVTAENASRGQRVADAFAALLDVRALMIEPPTTGPSARRSGYVAYYFYEQGRNTQAPTKLDKIAHILKERPPDSGDCQAIKDAFGFEFENNNSIVQRWCTSVANLEKTYRTLAGTGR